MSGNTFNITNKIDGDTGRPIPVAVTAVVPDGSNIAATWVALIFTHLVAALALWILAATLMPTLGLTYFATWGIVVTAKLILHRPHGIRWWVHPARKLV